jgi:hypothetical protein
VKTKIALFLSILLAFFLLADGIELRADLDDGVGEEAASTDAIASFLRLNDSRRSRSQEVKSKSSPRLAGLGARSERFLSAARIKKPSGFSQQELYSLQRVYRL